MMTDDQIIKVVQAHKEGKKIQCRKKDGEWFDAFPFWDFAVYEYRVAPEPPKPREWVLLVDRQSNGVYGVANEYNQNSPRTESVRVREVIGASSGNPTGASDIVSCNQ